VAERTRELSAALGRQRELAAYSDKVREEERTRIAREVHDELGSLLVALKMDVNWLDKRLSEQAAREPDAAQAMRERMRCKCHNMGRLIENAVDNVGRIITDLRPSILDHQGLWAALEWQAHEFVQSSELALDWDLRAPTAACRSCPSRRRWRCSASSRRCSATSAATRRQPAGRAHRHRRRAGCASRTTAAAPCAEAFEAATAYGVMGMRERALSLGGQLAITSAPGQGSPPSSCRCRCRPWLTASASCSPTTTASCARASSRCWPTRPEIEVCAEAVDRPAGARQGGGLLGGRAGPGRGAAGHRDAAARRPRRAAGAAQAWPRLPVLMLSTYPERQYAVRCIKLGAAGYMNKGADADDMVAAVRKVAGGGVYVTPITAEALVTAAAA
jgi:hypothetical protein